VTWIKAVSLDELQRRPVVIKHPPKQIAVFSFDGSVYAIDNRCPHEGYPLAAGKLSNDCVLTCNWHNWKFRLDTGECLIGGDDVRSYPTKVENGHAWINVADPPAEESRRRILDGLKSAFDDRDFGRICREIARLHYYGLDPVESVTTALVLAHDRLEFGTTHAIAAAADWLHLAGSYKEDFETRLICFSEAVDHLADDSLRQPEYPYAEPGAHRFEHSSFLAAVEEEAVDRVEAMVARALADGLHWLDLEEAFTAAAFAHYNDFGHSVIYVAKTGELIHTLGEGVERVLVLPLARNLCYTTREDLLPEFKDYVPTLVALQQAKGLPHSSAGPDVPFPAGILKAFEWLRANFGEYSVEQLYDRLLEALALSLLHYDVSYGARSDGPVSQNISWLDFTHGLTMANAARRLCARYPQFWKPALAQMACFLGRNFDFIDRAVDPNEWAIADTDGFFRDVHQKLFDHGLRDPIFSVHLLKTSLAVEEESEHTSASCRKALLAGLNRFLKSPLKTKHVRRTARQAIDLVSRDF
jgi:nitrite reductase/ring-hydroxylating ferredoxin subunit